MLSRRADSGSITVLVIGYAAITILLLAVGIAASKVFLARRALAAAADEAALRAVQAVSTERIYSTGLACGRALPISRAAASQAAAKAFAQSRPDLRRTFAGLSAPTTTVRAGVVTVRVSGTVRLPFRSSLGRLDPGRGQVTITETAHATSPVADC